MPVLTERGVIAVPPTVAFQALSGILVAATETTYNPPPGGITEYDGGIASPEYAVPWYAQVSFLCQLTLGLHWSPPQPVNLSNQMVLCPLAFVNITQVHVLLGRGCTINIDFEARLQT